ncbi:hypothetical protein HAX54_050568 [Datura stramonium]|uniref:Uncharacterized protein n=1 Tax=Datura stramonium TaxID=4076 RepID=A0ABS8SX55_DATST|nr:hypothetical protein [Datura stramonium]
MNSRRSGRCVEAAIRSIDFDLGLLRAAGSSSAIVCYNFRQVYCSDDEFSLAKVSFGVIGLGLGVSLLSLEYN